MDIKKRFESIQKKNPLYSSYTSFALAVSNAVISQMRLIELFDELVEKGDYAKRDRETVLEHLGKLNNGRVQV